MDSKKESKWQPDQYYSACIAVASNPFLGDTPPVNIFVPFQVQTPEAGNQHLMLNKLAALRGMDKEPVLISLTMCVEEIQPIVAYK